MEQVLTDDSTDFIKWKVTLNMELCIGPEIFTRKMGDIYTSCLTCHISSKQHGIVGMLQGSKGHVCYRYIYIIKNILQHA